MLLSNPIDFGVHSTSNPDGVEPDSGTCFNLKAPVSSASSQLVPAMILQEVTGQASVVSKKVLVDVSGMTDHPPLFYPVMSYHISGVV